MNLSQYHILVVDDDPKMRTLMRAVLETRGWSSKEASDGLQAIAMCETERPSIVLLDMRMPKLDGITTLRELKKIDSDLPVIIITAHADLQDAVNAIKLGAYDFIVKPPDFDRLAIVIDRALEQSKLSNGFKKLDATIDHSLESFLGSSNGMKRVVEQIRQVAATDFSVIMQGETGTGKTTVSRMIHNMSRRSLGPFVSVDVGSMPETLIESELFGHEKGAFTGADHKKKGFFEVAAGGTLLIDDLQNIPLHVQSKLLRAVEDKKIYPIGALAPVGIDVRIIVATNVDARKAMQENKLKSDLFYRLCEFIIDIPPLRERSHDIPYLGRNFMLEVSSELNKPMREISAHALEHLKKYAWPGNVRELKNVMRRAVLIAENDIITDAHLEFLIGGGYGSKIYAPLLQRDLPTLNLKELEQIAIKRALELAAGNKSEAASLLNIDYSTLHRKLKQTQSHQN
ncbi:MAG TPA: sigma-54 dependent transcriptional regulator [Dissulfurispiraceae bacterium]|nr:sigma-54 dependent transcriptional regulator [Dissulfurispiraceae bacterium]